MSTLQVLRQLPRRWLIDSMVGWRWLAVVGVLLFVPVMAFLASARQASLLLLLLIAPVAALLGVYVFTRWPSLGVVLLIPAGIMVPFAVGTGTQTRLDAGILVLVALTALWLFEMIHEQRSVRLLSVAPIRPLLLFVLVSVLAFFSGQLGWFPVEPASMAAQVGGLSVFILSAAAFLLAAHRIQEPRWLEYMTWTFIGVGALHVVCRMHPALYPLNDRLFQWGGTGAIFWAWLTALTFSQAWLNTNLRPHWRVALWVLVALIVYVAYGQTFDWKSGWLPPLAAIVSIMAMRSWRLAGLLVIAGLVAAPVLAGQVIASDEYSYSTRVDAWMAVGEVIKANPILGLGPSNYYFYTPLTEIRGYRFLQFNSHNQYIDIVAQVGLLGLLFFAWFTWEIGRYGWQMRARVPEGFPRAFVYGALGGLVATLVAGMLGDWILPFVYNVGLVGMRSSLLAWLFLGGLIALGQIYGMERKT